MSADAIFDPELLSDCVVQIKFRGVEADMKAGHKIMPHDAMLNDGALPYLALQMELGTESEHQTTRSKIQVTTPPANPSDDGQYQAEEDWMSAVTRLAQYEENNSKREEQKNIRELREAVKVKRLAMDSCNRYYSISVRGAGPDTYGILKEADIVDEFAALLRITTSSSSSSSTTPQDIACQHMQPLKYLAETLPNTAWMA